MNRIHRCTSGFLAVVLATGILVAAGPGVAPEGSISMKIDAARTGEPISKYIYGQFIEHLGQCIYGGIWAEMLEDRKFFHPVGAKESPWKPIGGDAAVTMNATDPYVNAHTPEVKAIQTARGIAQGGLALRKGRKYVGRVVLAGDAGAAVSVRLVWGAGKGGSQTVAARKLTGKFGKTPFRFTADGDTDDGRLEIVATGGGTVRIGAVSLMPADHVQGMRADTLALLKELDSPVYRWPGGNFVSGYDWRDGVGDPDQRPTRRNPAWRGIDANDMGLHEFLTFCEILGTEPYIAVNAGFGDDFSAAQEVEYVNGAADTPMGKWRAANGQTKPWGVTWWGIGNEMYGRWQLGHIPLIQYVRKHNRFAVAMRKVDPSITLVGVGEIIGFGGWSEGMLKSCADHMEHISEHFYCKEKQPIPAHVAQPRERIRIKADAHRALRKKLPELKGKDIRIVLDEWNYWYGPHVYGELGTRYFLKDALGIAAGIHEMARNSDLFLMANYAQTVNVIGCIKTTKTDAAFATTGLVLKLYRQHFGVLPLTVTGVPAPLDAAAALTKDRKALTVAVVNPTMQRRTIQLNASGFTPSGTGTMWLITGANSMVYNEPGRPPQVVIREKTIDDAAVLTAPPLSVVLYRLPAK